MDKRSFIQNLYQEYSSFSKRQAEMVSSLLDTVSSDIYSESQRFVFELIQNADDASLNNYNEVYFDFFSNYLVVSHIGKGFDTKDIESLTSAGTSTKSADQTKTGYKGIGFKSVFGQSKKVTIFSNGYQFRFDKSAHNKRIPWQVIPIWTDIKDLNPEIQNIINVNNYSVSTIIQIDEADLLLEELKKLLNNGQILLFLRSVSKISITYNINNTLTIVKEITNNESYYSEVSLVINGNKSSSWLTKTFDHIPIPWDTKIKLKEDDKSPDKLKEAEYTELTFAVKIENKIIIPLESHESLIYNYLPTKIIDFGFPFLINGSFLTTAARESIHIDRVWNQWVFKLIGEKIIEWLAILSKSKYKYQSLQLLPSKFNGVHNDLKTAFNHSINHQIKETAFIPTKNDRVKRIDEIVIDKTGLSELIFISPATVIDFINQMEKTHFTVDSIAHPELQKTSNLRSYGAKFFAPNNLEDFFLSETFIKSHNSYDNFSLIEYFFEKSRYGEDKEWNQKLKSIPFIYSNEGSLIAPEFICFPSITFETEFGNGVSVIHNEVYSKVLKNSNILEWLGFLGVKEPSNLAYLENEIIGKIDTCINRDNYFEITRYLFKQHKKGLLNNTHYDQLKELKILTIKQDLIPAKECYLSDYYEPSLKLEKVNNEGHYVSDLYREDHELLSEWKTFFIKIGIGNDININNLRWLKKTELNSLGVHNTYFQEGIIKAKSMPNYDNFPIDGINNISIITFIKYASIYDFSKLFWCQILNKYNPSQFDSKPCLNMGYFNGYCYLTDYNMWAFQNLSIFPTTMHKCLKASDTLVNDKILRDTAGKHLPVLDLEEPLTDEWRDFLPFKDKLELSDLLFILENIATDTEAVSNNEKPSVSTDDKKRIELIYSNLLSLLPDLRSEKKQQISEWATKNKLLSNNGTFDDPSKMFWLKDEMRYNSNDLNLIFLPDILLDDEYVEELLSLFGISIISDISLEKINPVGNDSLQNELLSISPYLSAIISQVNGDDFESTFLKLKATIKQIKIFSTERIELAYVQENRLKVFAKPDSFFDKNENALFFTGNWKSPITMYSLIEEICKAVHIQKFQNELRLFLELDSEKIEEWLDSKFHITKKDVETNPAIAKFLEEMIPAIEEEIRPSDASILLDNSSIKTRISINEEAQEIIFDTLERNHFIVENRNKISFTILDGIKTSEGKLIKVVVKSAKAGKIYFTPLEWLALAEDDTQLFVLTARNKVRNVTLSDLQSFNDEFHMRFNTERFVLSNLKAFAQFFRGLPYTHFIFITPDSNADYLQEFGLSDRNLSSIELTADDFNLLS